jgi:CubicO group peptidase (beta-lactamase class C family)
MGSVGDFSWPGASGTNWWADPREELAVVFMAHSPGPIRWHYRQAINALVYQAIVDQERFFEPNEASGRGTAISLKRRRRIKACVNHPCTTRAGTNTNSPKIRRRQLTMARCLQPASIGRLSRVPGRCRSTSRPCSS